MLGNFYSALPLPNHFLFVLKSLSKFVADCVQRKEEEDDRVFCLQECRQVAQEQGSSRGTHAREICFLFAESVISFLVYLRLNA